MDARRADGFPSWRRISRVEEDEDDNKGRYWIHWHPPDSFERRNQSSLPSSPSHALSETRAVRSRVVVVLDPRVGNLFLLDVRFRLLPSRKTSILLSKGQQRG